MKKILTSIILCLLIVSCASKSELSKDEKKAMIYFRYGTTSLVRAQYTDALENLIKANNLKKNDAEILNNLAMAYFYKKRKNKALSLLDRAIELKEEHSDAIINKASILMSLKRFEEAEKLLTIVLDHLLFKKQFITYANLAEIQIQKGNLDKALMLTLKSLDENPQHCVSLFNKGYIYLKMNRYNEANTALKESYQGVCFKNPRAHYYYGLNLKNLKQWSKAEEALEKVYIQFPKTEFSSMAKIHLKEIRKNKKFKEISRSEFYTPDF